MSATISEPIEDDDRARARPHFPCLCPHCPSTGAHPAGQSSARSSGQGVGRIGGEGAPSLADLSPEQLIDEATHRRALKGWAEAGEIDVLTEFARRHTTHPDAAGGEGTLAGSLQEFAAAEIACALTLAHKTAQDLICQAAFYSERIPNAVDALRAGLLDYSRFRTIYDDTIGLSDQDAHVLAQEIIDILTGGRPLTRRQIQNKLRPRVMQLRSRDHDDETERAEAKKKQDVYVRTLSDSTTELVAILHAGELASIYAVINSAAHTAKTTGDQRPIGQIRAAVLMDLILGRLHPPTTKSTRTTPEDNETAGIGSGCGLTAPGFTVNVTIAFSEFMNLVRQNTTTDGRLAAPGHIEGIGNIPAWMVRDLVRDIITRTGTRFRAVVFDDDTGELKTVSSPKYVPPPALADHVRYRDLVCRFPGCARPARRCDVDHVLAWHKGGKTEGCNLECLCRHDHRRKQGTAWAVRFADGICYWTAPTGHTYRTWNHDWREPQHLYETPLQNEALTELDDEDELPPDEMIA